VIHGTVRPRRLCVPRPRSILGQPAAREGLVRTILRSLVALPVVALAAACGGGSRANDAPLSADLQKDLDLAKSTGIELASASRRAPLAVSGVEAVPVGRARQADRAERPTPRRQSPPAITQVARRSAEMAEAPVPDVEAEVEAALGEAPAFEEAPAGELAEAPVAAETPEVISGPQALPEGIGAGRPRDPGGWGDVGVGRGTGSVVRGGSVGDVDHCEIHGGRGTIIAIGRRMPPVFNPRSSGGYPSNVVFGGSSGGRQRAGGSMIRGRGVIPSISTASAPAGGSVVGGGARRRN
jgi:hypothetical protein